MEVAKKSSVGSSKSEAGVRRRARKSGRLRTFTGFTPLPTGQVTDLRFRSYGPFATEVIEIWTHGGSANIRKFFLDGTIPKWSAKIVEIYVPLNPAHVLQSLFAFTQVMNNQGRTRLTTADKAVVMYRGVNYNVDDELPERGSTISNVLTNWTRNPTMSTFWVSDMGGILRCRFPEGTRFLYTQTAEDEHIVPGGRFVLVGGPRTLAVEHHIEERKARVWDLVFEPRGQKLLWPANSPSPDTRKRFHDQIKDLIIQPAQRLAQRQST